LGAKREHLLELIDRNQRCQQTRRGSPELETVEIFPECARRLPLLDLDLGVRGRRSQLQDDLLLQVVLAASGEVETNDQRKVVFDLQGGSQTGLQKRRLAQP